LAGTAGLCSAVAVSGTLVGKGGLASLPIREGYLPSGN
jgi:hypothetical protein